jgi:uncharacterized protein YdaU (DUF1376 family)
MPLYVADYLADTAHLSCEESGAYLALIMHYWRAGSLPQEDDRLARIVKLDLERWLCVRIPVAMLFQDCWRHKRIDAELSRAAEKSGKAKASANKRWTSEKATTSDTTAMRTHSEGTAEAMLSQSQSQSEGKEEKKEPREARSVAVASADAFNRFWDAYPEKVGKKPAAMAFLKVASEVEPILEGLAAYIRNKPADRSWLNPSTFINQRRWEDRPAQNSGAQNGQGQCGGSVGNAAGEWANIFDSQSQSGGFQEGAAPMRLLPAR